ncbi:mRNA 3'-end-processing protein rna14 [Allomyces arbusculus]|nr:mRNA 3'-end-processing protein rna14 [Allomyces arbusculus]
MADSASAPTNAADTASGPAADAPQDLLAQLSAPLPPRMERLYQRTQEDEYDIEAWFALLHEFLSTPSTRDRDDDRRALFDRALAKFPYSDRLWIMAIDAEVKGKSPDCVPQMFAKALRTVRSFEVYRVYLNYIRRTHAVAHEGRGVIKQAYDFVLSHAAHDRNSFSVWNDYLSFLKSIQVNSEYEHQEKQNEIRAAYQRAVTLPIQNVEQLWREWDTFESGISRPQARKLLQERNQAYLAARNAGRTLRSLWDPLERVTPIVTPPTFSPSERALLAQWRKLLSWEKSNPFKYEDMATLYQRVSWTYWQAINCLCRFPELWYEFAMFATSMNKSTEALTILKAGCEACPGSFLVHFALADLHETKDDPAKSKGVYESLVTYWTAEVDKALDRDSPAADSSAPAAPAGTTSAPPPASPAVQRAKDKLAMCWIQYMRHAARASGIKEMRAVFKRARNMRYCTWQVIAASALLEYHRGADAAVPKRLLAYACAQFPSDPAPLLVFADWLLAVRDDTNLASTLVTAIRAPALSKDAQKRLAEKLASVYAQTADLKTLTAHERDMDEAFPDAAGALDHARRRYAFLNLDCVATHDLGVAPAAATAAAALAYGTGAAGLGALGEDVVAQLAALGASAAPSAATPTAQADANGTAADTGAQMDLEGTKKRVLDEWVPLRATPAPNTRFGGWAVFRPPPMAPDEMRAHQDRARAAAALSQRLVQEDRNLEYQGPGQHVPPAPSQQQQVAASSSSAAGGGSGVPQPVTVPPVVETPMEVMVELLRKLPPPEAFTGPFLDVQGILSLLDSNSKVPVLGATLDEPRDPRDPRRRKRRDDDGGMPPGKRYRS